MVRKKKKREQVSIRKEEGRTIFHLLAGVKSSPHVPLLQELTHLSEEDGERNLSPHLLQKTFNSRFFDFFHSLFCLLLIFQSQTHQQQDRTAHT